MYHTSNILKNLKLSFAWKSIWYFLLDSNLGERVEHKKLSLMLKKLQVVSRDKTKGLSLVPRSPLVSLGLRKNHPLFVEYHFRSFDREVNNHGKNKPH